MKKSLLIVAISLFSLGIAAQEETKKEEGFVFTTLKENPITSIKNQNRSSTCWSFSSLGFLESELLRKGKGTFDFSEMFIVHHTMSDRAEKYVRLHSEGSFGPGGSFEDIIYALKNYGLVPQEVMTGLNYGDTLPVHNELDATMTAYLNAIAKSDSKKLTTAWKRGFDGILDAYLGQRPTEFTYKGKKYTPMSFVKELGLNPDDYVSITSFSHHPYYSKFALEIPDNWRMAESYNLPVDEMMQVFDNAVNKGYTVAWGADVSESGFTRNGIGVVPQEVKTTELKGSDMVRWTGLTKKEKDEELTSKPLPEKEISQADRQLAYDNWETTDDHGLLIYGLAKDQNGKEYYMVKNSWGETGKYKGIWYISKTYAKYKTMNILVHKDALPKEIAKKLGIK